MGKKRIDSEKAPNSKRAGVPTSQSTATAPKPASPNRRRAGVRADPESSVEGPTSKPGGKVPRVKKAAPTVQTPSLRRHELIAETAYFLAEQRGFAAGLELDDWLKAESAVDARLAGRGD